MALGGLRSIVCILLVCVTVARASDPHLAACKALGEIAAHPEAYKTSRGIAAYLMKFGHRWENEIGTLDRDSLILDGGAGQGLTGERYLEFYPGRASYRGVSLEGVPTDIYAGRKRIHGDRYEQLTGHPIESLENRALGTPDWVLDYFGAFSYSAHPEEVLAKYLDVAHEDTSISLLLGANVFDSPFSYVETPHGRMTLQAWLGTIENLRVVPMGNGPETYVLRVVDPMKPVRLPRLKLARIGEGLPPSREFTVENELLTIAPKITALASPPRTGAELLSRATGTQGTELRSLVYGSLGVVGQLSPTEVVRLLEMPLSRTLRRLVLQSYFATTPSLSANDLRAMQATLRITQPATLQWALLYGTIRLRDREPAELKGFVARANHDAPWLHAGTPIFEPVSKRVPDLVLGIMNRLRGRARNAVAPNFVAEKIPRDFVQLKDARDLEFYLPLVHKLTAAKILDMTKANTVADRAGLVLQALPYIRPLDEAAVAQLARETLLPRELILAAGRR